MKLTEALQILKEATASDSSAFAVALVCGFTPLHLGTFLGASLQSSIRDRHVRIETGLYGDCLGGLRRLETQAVDAAAVVLEWADFDPRLGLRNLGGWGPQDLSDILHQARAGAGLICEGLQKGAQSTLIALSPPTLPIVPAAFTPTWQASEFDAELRALAWSVAREAVKEHQIRILNPQTLDRLSAPHNRLDVQSEILTGFPYKLGHASALGALLARLIHNPIPKKGLITDLDDTLWKGILGEVGVQGISWDLDHQSHVHGLYQKLLAALAEEGVLIAAASKNDANLVRKAFEHPDLILKLEHVYPLEVHWGPKSESVSRILRRWNVGADDVVFIDDSPMELAEVQSMHPDVECILFPKEDRQAAYDLLGQLRDLFGKSTISDEDGIRLESIRRTGALAEEADVPSGSVDRFLEEAGAELTLSFGNNPPDPRALELVNKTNQFNLNGRRYTESEWPAHLSQPGTFLLLVAYRDKYGPLGKIAVVSGREHEGRLRVNVWVMSCRAFSRRIEHQCLAQLFRKFKVDEIAFDLVPTPKNGPLRSFFEELVGQPLGREARIGRQLFVERCPRLFHQVKEL